MNFVFRAIPPALVAALAAALVPPLGREFAPGFRFDVFLPIVAFVATGERLFFCIPAAWFLGAAADALAGTPAGTSVFGYQVIVVGMHAASRWLSFRSPTGFGSLVLLLALLNSSVQYLVLTIVGHKAVLEWGVTTADALRTGLWGVAVYFLLGGAERLAGRLVGRARDGKGAS
ncbi:MAG: hypothetical protein HY897_15820 [Deltaproteobacteria bacterium]|nr:hypothetical protein [Deltaproteobacteria bacterium]